MLNIKRGTESNSLSELCGASQQDPVHRTETGNKEPKPYSRSARLNVSVCIWSLTCLVFTKKSNSIRCLKNKVMIKFSSWLFFIRITFIDQIFSPLAEKGPFINDIL